MNIQKAYLVTGGTSKLGEGLLQHYSGIPGNMCFAMSRGDLNEGLQDSAISQHSCNLVSSENVQESISDIFDKIRLIETVSELNIIHCVGAFRLEYDGHNEDLMRERAKRQLWINDPYKLSESEDVCVKTMESNLVTTRNLGDALISELRGFEKSRRKTDHLKVKFGTYGSVTENRRIAALWQTFALSKILTADYLKDITQRNRHLGKTELSTYNIKLSTVETYAEVDLRPKATEDTRRFWLSPDEVVLHTDAVLQTLSEGQFGISERFKNNTAFTQQYYDGVDEAMKRWKFQAELDKTAPAADW